MTASRWLAALVRHLREAGVGVPPSRLVDAARALALLDDPPDREMLRDVLRLVLTRAREERPRFDAVFNRWVASHRPPGMRKRKALSRPAGAGDADGAGAARSASARKTPAPSWEREREAGKAPAPSWEREREAGKALDPSGNREREAGKASDRGLRGIGEDVEAWLAWALGGAEREEESLAETHTPRSERLESTVNLPRSERLAVESKVNLPRNERLTAQRGGGGFPDLPLDGRMTPAEEALILAAVTAMARELWLRRSRRSRRWKAGRVSVKATIAQSMRSDGIPFRIVRRKRRLRLARLLLLLDVSGSVRNAARFLLALARALREAFASVRAFAFVDRPVEVRTEDFEPLKEPDIDWMGKSDFGNTFFRLLEDHPRALGKDTVVVLLGDARNNFVDPMPWALGQIREQCARVMWLNPEPRRRWNSGDSVMAAYAPYCDVVERCGNTADLRKVAERWLRYAARWR